MKAKLSKRASAHKLDAEITREFDGNGVRRALLAALTAVYTKAPHVTLPQLLVALEILIAERNGEPHTLVSLVKKLGMPFSTASRVVWSLTRDGGDLGIIKYERHPTDRRKKYLVMDPDNIERDMPRAITRAMIDYYGDSVKKLQHVNAS